MHNLKKEFTALKGKNGYDFQRLLIISEQDVTAVGCTYFKSVELAITE